MLQATIRGPKTTVKSIQEISGSSFLCKIPRSSSDLDLRSTRIFPVHALFVRRQRRKTDRWIRFNYQKNVMIFSWVIWRSFVLFFMQISWYKGLDFNRTNPLPLLDGQLSSFEGNLTLLVLWLISMHCYSVFCFN